MTILQHATCDDAPKCETLLQKSFEVQRKSVKHKLFIISFFINKRISSISEVQRLNVLCWIKAAFSMTFRKKYMVTQKKLACTYQVYEVDYKKFTIARK